LRWLLGLVEFLSPRLRRFSMYPPLSMQREGCSENKRTSGGLILLRKALGAIAF
jgi:hypothetical protein